MKTRNRQFYSDIKRVGISFGVMLGVVLILFVVMVNNVGYVDEAPVSLLTGEDIKPQTALLVSTTMPLSALSSLNINRTRQTDVVSLPDDEERIEISARTQDIYEAGLAAGNDPNTFSTVGDCITAIHPFMVGFDSGDYHLGAYDYLQPAVDQFDGSYGRGSQASGNNFTTATVLDPMWTSDRICEIGETPLACEYRLTNPSIAVIMLGTNDVSRFGVDLYRNFLIDILDYTIEQNIVPVLTTFPTLPNYYATQSELFNAVVVELAESYDIPLIDLRSAVVDLPDHGMNLDGLHPSNRGDGFIDFRGEQYQYGMTMRDLVTLQMLDAISHSAG